MPGIFFEPKTRRDFFKTTSAAILLAGLTGSPLRADNKTENNLRLALLSDLHFPADPLETYRGFLPEENLQKIILPVRDSQSAAVLINGDAARLLGLEADYIKLKGALTPIAEKVPIIVGMGNHDDRENFAKIFEPSPLKKKVPGKHVLVMEEPSLRIVILDSLLYVNKTAGLLGKAQRDWLGEYLIQTDDKPTVIFVHHTLGENDGELLDAEKFLDIVSPHKKVKAIFYGHSHRYSFDERDGMHLVNLPAVGYNFNDNEPVGWVQSEFNKEGVELTLQAIGGNTKAHGQKVSLKWR